MAANERTQVYEHNDEEYMMEDEQHPGQEHPIYHHADPFMDSESFSQIVSAAAETATMSIFTALGSGTLRLPHSVPAPSPAPGPNENRSSDENQSEAEASQLFQRRCPCITSA